MYLYRKWNYPPSWKSLSDILVIIEDLTAERAELVDYRQTIRKLKGKRAYVHLLNYQIDQIDWCLNVARSELKVYENYQRERENVSSD